MEIEIVEDQIWFKVAARLPYTIKSCDMIKYLVLLNKSAVDDIKDIILKLFRIKKIKPLLFAFVLSTLLIGTTIFDIPGLATASSPFAAAQVPVTITAGNISGPTLQENRLKGVPFSEATISLLLNDTISALKSGDTNTALSHLKLVDQELTAAVGNTTSTQIQRLFVSDAIQSIQNGDIKKALAHLNLLAQEVTVPSSNNSVTARPQSTISKLQTNVSNFSTYSNPIVGLTIEYPHDWQVAEHTINPAANNTIVSFFSSSKSASALGNISGVSGNFVPYVDIYAFTSKNIPLPKLVNETFNNLKNITVLESKPLTLKSGAPAYIVIYSIVVAGDESFKKMQLWTINAGDIYVITYTAQAGLFSNYLPLVQNMFHTFAFITGINTHNLKGGHPSVTKLNIPPAAPPKRQLPPLSH